MKINICWAINVDGLWWDVESEHQVSDALSSADKRARIRGIIKGITAGCKVIPRAIGSGAMPEEGNKARETIESPPATSSAFTWPIPHCKVHATAMAQSKIQEEEGLVFFYCPKRIGEGYCKHRAHVASDSGMPKFWEVK